MLRQSTAAVLFCAGLLAPRAALAAEIVSGDYYENAVIEGSNACTTTGCTIYLPFGPATAGKTLRITAVDCIVQSGGPVDYAQYFLADNSSGQNARRFHALDITPTDAARTIGFHDQLDYKVAGGPPRHFAVEIGGRGAVVWTGIQCGVIGRIEAQ